MSASRPLRVREKALHHRPRLLHRGTRQQHREPLAADPRSHVHAPKTAGAQLADTAQHGIPTGVAP